MNTALIAYDLKQVKPDDNSRVKKALEAYTDTFTQLGGGNVLSPFAEWIRLKLPDTTLICASGAAGLTAKTLADNVIAIIRKEGAIPDKGYVAFIEGSTDY